MKTALCGVLSVYTNSETALIANCFPSESGAAANFREASWLADPSQIDGRIGPIALEIGDIKTA